MCGCSVSDKGEDRRMNGNSMKGTRMSDNRMSGSGVCDEGEEQTMNAQTASGAVCGSGVCDKGVDRRMKGTSIKGTTMSDNRKSGSSVCDKGVDQIMCGSRVSDTGEDPIMSDTENVQTANGAMCRSGLCDTVEKQAIGGGSTGDEGKNQTMNETVMNEATASGTITGSGDGAVVSIFEFRDRVRVEILEFIPEEYRVGLTIKDVDVVKINDQKLCGLSFNTEGYKAAPTFYLNEIYEEYLRGLPERSMVRQLANSFLFTAQGMEQEMEDKVAHEYEKGFDDIRDRLVVKVLEAERNREFLKTVVHSDIGNGFALVYDVQNVINGNDVWRMPVTRTVLEHAGVDESELYDIAMDNVSEVDPPVLFTLERRQSGRRPRNLLENNRRIRKERRLMYVLTNSMGKYGAAVLFYPGMMKRIADRIDDSYFAVPTSVHEFVIVPESADADMEWVSGRLVADNKAAENKADVFSDRVFRYDREMGQFTCVSGMFGAGGGGC